MNKYELELEELETELKEVESMQESEACDKYNVDFKWEIIKILKEEIQIIAQAINYRVAW